MRPTGHRYDAEEYLGISVVYTDTSLNNKLITLLEINQDTHTS